VLITEKEKFLLQCETHISRQGIDDLLAWLEKTDFYTAPASTKYHGAFEGGLLKHSLNVFDRLLDVVGFSSETTAICALFHDICKVNFYKKDWKNQKRYHEKGSKKDEAGRYDWEAVPTYTVEDKLPYGHGEKSVYILSGFMKLSREEAMAIRWHMGGFDDSAKGGSYAVSEAFRQFPLACKLHAADLFATFMDETTEAGNGAVT
jgi:hypothetical protein